MTQTFHRRWPPAQNITHRFLSQLAFLAPVILWLFCANGIRAEEILFYSLAEESVNPPLEEQYRAEFPARQLILLNGAWELKDPVSGLKMGTVRIPCTFRGAPHLRFEKSVTIRKKPGSRCMLHLGSVVGSVTVWLNDSLLFSGKRNYFPVSLPLPETYLRTGENQLRIDVETQNRRRADLPGFYPINLPRVDYGLPDAIYLEIFPGLSIESVQVGAALLDSAAAISGTVRFSRRLPENSPARLTVRYLEGAELLREIRMPLRQGGMDQVLIPESRIPRLVPWSPATPRRYQVEVTLDSAGTVLDQVRQSLSVRAAGTSPGALLWNQQPLPLEGVNYVYQTREGAGVFDRDLIRRDLQDIKSRGYNAVRVILYPLPEWFYRFCDEIGLLVFQDLPLVYWQRPGSGPTGAQTLREDWQAFGRYLSGLAYRYSSIAGVGLAYYPDGTAPAQQKRLNLLAGDLRPHAPVPLYAATAMPDPRLSEAVDFLIVDIPGRVRASWNVYRVQEVLGRALFFPAAFTKAMTLRLDSMKVAQELLLTRDFYLQYRRGKLPGKIAGQFIHTYNDFFGELPSIQNGGIRDFFLNHTGLVSLTRQPRDLDSFPDGSDPGSGLLAGVQPEDRGAPSFLYILLGFLNVFVFLITYRRYRVFRHNLVYSINKPHGFFVNLLERIIIPYKQSFFILLVIALNGALIYSAIFYYFRNHLLADYLLSLIFYTPWLKLQVARLIWNPPVFIVLGSVAIVFFFYFLAILVKAFSFLGRSRVLFNQALAMSIWAASPFVILLPVGIVMYSLLLMMKNYWIILAILLYFHVWAYLRWINGIRVLTDRFYWQAFLFFTLLLFGTVGVFGYFYEEHYHFWQHIEYVRHLRAFWK